MYVFEIKLNKVEFDKYCKSSIVRCKLENNMDFNFYIWLIRTSQFNESLLTK